MPLLELLKLLTFERSGRSVASRGFDLFIRPLGFAASLEAALLARLVASRYHFGWPSGKPMALRVSSSGITWLYTQPCCIKSQPPVRIQNVQNCFVPGTILGRVFFAAGEATGAWAGAGAGADSEARAGTRAGGGITTGAGATTGAETTTGAGTATGARTGVRVREGIGAASLLYSSLFYSKKKKVKSVNKILTRRVS